jgi:DNA-binding SARP family transcriptional activator
MSLPAPLLVRPSTRETAASAAGAALWGRPGDRPEAHVTLRLLGGFDLTIDGKSKSLPVPAQRLLAFLALNERSVLRAHVAEVLWLESTEGHARASLRSAIWRLRRSGHGLIQVTNQCLRLGSEVVVDARVLVDWARSVLEAEQGFEHLPPVAALGDGLTGDLLPDWYDEWLIVDRERLRELHARALERACERLTAAGSFQQAVEAGLAALDTDPLRESTHRCLIGLHLAEGNQAEALHSYFLYRDLLHERLGLDPSARMEDLVRGLRGRQR